MSLKLHEERRLSQESLRAFSNGFPTEKTVRKPSSKSMPFNFLGYRIPSSLERQDSRVGTLSFCRRVLCEGLPLWVLADTERNQGQMLPTEP